MADAIPYMTARELRDHYVRGSLSPVEVLDVILERAAAVEPDINAFTEILFEEARGAARASETRFRSAPETARPLEGIPVALKEEQAIEGHAIRSGSLLTEDFPQEKDHPVVERTRAAGAVMHARTATPEFSASYTTSTKLWGVTRNPWDLALSPGGSSGGAGASLAAGTTTLASASDIAGSIRIPANLSGVVGFKPTHGRVPTALPYNLVTANHEGPMARSVEDCATYYNIIAGPHPADPVTLPYEKVSLDNLSAPTRIVVLREIGDYVVDPIIWSVFDSLTDSLRAAGVEVTEAALDVRRTDIRHCLFASNAATEFEEPDDRQTWYIQRMPELSREAHSALSPSDALLMQSEIQRTILDAFDGTELLIMPVLGAVSIAADANFVENPLVINGIALDNEMDGSFTPLFNLASRHPVVSLPVGLTQSGLPVGAQIVGRPYADGDTLRAAAWLERELGLTTSPSWRPTGIQSVRR